MSEPCPTGQHDYEHPIRHGRADYRCPKCGKNIMLELVYIQDALHDELAKEVSSE